MFNNYHIIIQVKTIITFIAKRSKRIRMKTIIIIIKCLLTVKPKKEPTTEWKKLSIMRIVRSKLLKTEFIQERIFLKVKKKEKKSNIFLLFLYGNACLANYFPKEYYLKRLLYSLFFFYIFFPVIIIK